MAELTREQHLAAIIPVLRVALRHPNLLHHDAFQEFASTLRATVMFDQLAVVLLDGPEHVRLYARSPGAESVVPFGGRVPLTAQGRTHLRAGVPRRCDDTRLGSDLERATAASGLLSYVSLPLRDGQSDDAVLGTLVFAFREAGAVAAAPMDFVTEVAAIVESNLGRSLALSRERRFAMILATSGDAMLAWDREGRVTDANAAASALTGLSRGELIGRPIDELIGPLPPIGKAGSASGVRMELLPRAGEEGGTAREHRTVAATITAVDDDPLVAGHALLRDLSDIVSAEREAASRLARIRELEEQHRTLLDNAPLIIFRLDPRTTELVYLNLHAERLLGVPTAEALMTKGFLRDAHADPEGVMAFDEAVARAQRGAGSLPYEARLRRRHGDAITARGTVYPLLSESSEVVAIEGVLADVSVEQAARTRLIQTDRLSTLGTLAAGVAHEINNPAAFILLGLDMLDRLLRGPGVQMEASIAASAGDLLRELRDSIKRIVDIARDLRLFASPPAHDASRRTVIDVNRTVESALTLTRGQILERAQVALDLGEVPPVLMDDGRLGQVVVNLLVNASQAIPKTYDRNHTVSVKTRSDGRTVEIEVCDTGVGISEDNLQRIWTPFFTTKSADVGTGLGLPISREIVERAGGTITAESPVRDGATIRGSRFVIALPAAGRHESVTPISSPLPRLTSKPARVLVVEDEPMLARALAEELGAVHKVEVAEGAQQALARLAIQRYDVILCDLRMPEMSGEALYAHVREKNPKQAEAFVFMTGVGFGADVERFLAAAGRPVLEKPFAPNDALRIIAKICAKQA